LSNLTAPQHARGPVSATVDGNRASLMLRTHGDRATWVEKTHNPPYVRSFFPCSNIHTTSSLTKYLAFGMARAFLFGSKAVGWKATYRRALVLGLD
jgi:hypothetical protein